MQHLGPAPGVQARHLLQGREGDLVGGGVAEPHAVELHGHGALGNRACLRLLGDERLQVEHLEDPLEADQRAHDLHARPGQRGERCVQPRQEQGERDDRARFQGALQGVVAAEAVDQGERESRDEGEGGDERGLRHRRTDADVTHPPGAGGEFGGLVGGPPEQLDQGGAGRREPLGHPGAHRGVVLGGLPLEAGHPGAHAARGQYEHRQQDEREQGDLPGEAEHHSEREQQRDEVADHAGEGVAEGPLGADDVVVEAADERAGAGPGEERDGHPLHMVEDGGPQIEDQSFTERRRQPSTRDAEPRLRHRDRGDEQGEPGHGAAVVPADDRVDDAPGEEWRGHRQQSRCDAQHEEQRDAAAVRAGENGDAPQSG